MGMGPQEQQTVAHLAQTVAQVASDTGVSWELFKWGIGLSLAYATGCYGMLWKLFMLSKDGRDRLWGAIEQLKSNDIQHLKDEINELKRKR